MTTAELEAFIASPELFDWRSMLASGQFPGFVKSKENLTEHKSFKQNAMRLAKKTVTVTMLAGASSRWVESIQRLEAIRQIDTKSKHAEYKNLDAGAPRGLYPVRNYMGFGQDPIAIAAYALAAVKDLGRHIIVVRGWKKEIEQSVILPAAYEKGSWSFVNQDAPGGKPRGHGAGIFKALPLLAKSDYVIVNFGGDAANPLTALAGLSVLDCFNSINSDSLIGLILPVCLSDKRLYSITLDEDGLPLAFGHNKLGTAPGNAQADYKPGPEARTYSNVGLRIYKTKWLIEAILEIRSKYWSKDGGYNIPGNAKANDAYGGEFALDNVDTLLAEQGRARVLHVARAEELSPVKCIEDISAFEQSMAALSRDWQAYRQS